MSRSATSNSQQDFKSSHPTIEIRIRVTAGAFELACQGPGRKRGFRARRAAPPPHGNHKTSPLDLALACASTFCATQYVPYIDFRVLLPFCMCWPVMGEGSKQFASPLGPCPCQLYFIEVALLDSGMVGPDLSHAPV